MYLMSDYDSALQTILGRGVLTPDRTGIGRITYPGITCRYVLDVDGRFPIISRRKIFPKSIFAELLWFLSGSTNTLNLNKLGSKIWDPWKNKSFDEDYGEGELGPVYGFQLRHFGANYADMISGIPGVNRGFDQLQYMVGELKNNKHSTRILFDLWNPNDIHLMRLPPCHFHFQAVVNGNDELTGILTQRSADFPIGVPANVQFYSALTIMLAQQAGLKAYEFVHNTIHSHIYANQVDAVKEYLSTPIVDSPKLEILPCDDIFSYTPDHFKLTKYAPGKAIKIPVAVD